MSATDGYADAREIRRNVARLAQPVTRKSVSQVVADSLKIETPGGFAGPWDRDTFPYMSEPMDLTSSRNVQAVIFCGPAQCGKTFSLIGGRIVYATVHDPADQLLIHMTQDTARDWSRKELDRWIKHSPDLQARQSKRPRDDNTFDKFWLDGSVLKIAWPSIPQVASKSVRDVLITDYDRMPIDIGGEGSVFFLTLKRLQAWLSRGIAVCESSPGRDVPIEHARWVRPAGTHLAPPVTGVLGLYNDGDRRWWHWQCPDCREWFHASPGVELFGLPRAEDIIEQLASYSVSQIVARHSSINCPHCGSKIEQSQKRALNIAGRWLVEGETIDNYGDVRGEPVRSAFASFWLGGIPAAFQSWPSIVEKYVNGLQTWARTGDSSTLKTTVNTDQAMPFTPITGGKEIQSADALAQTAESWQRATVTKDVRFIVLVADVQASKFVVQAIGFGPGRVVDREQQLEWWLIDRFLLKTSKRNAAALNPAAYLEDWSVLSDCLAHGYPLADGSGKHMLPYILGSDSGGRAGVTNNAYDWWRLMQSKGLGNRVRLMKGEGKQGAPRVEMRMPNQRGRKDRNSSVKGDVPVCFVGSTVLKDALAGQLERCAAGDGGVHFGQGFESEVFQEFTAEYRGDTSWICPDGVRNEATDLAVYAMGLAISLRAHEPAFWRAPPSWAQPHETNSMVLAPDAQPPTRTARPLARAFSNYMRR